MKTITVFVVSVAVALQVIRESEGMTSIKETVEGLKEKHDKISRAAKEGITIDLSRISIDDLFEGLIEHPMSQSVTIHLRAFLFCIIDIPIDIRDITVKKAQSSYEEIWTTLVKDVVEKCVPPLPKCCVDKFHDDCKQIVEKRIDEMVKAEGFITKEVKGAKEIKDAEKDQDAKGAEKAQAAKLAKGVKEKETTAPKEKKDKKEKKH